jgi:protein arginine N-methyltransferase 5
MFSWFPILFPLREPIQLKKDDIITLHFWRLVSKAERPLFFLFEKPCVPGVIYISLRGFL